MNIRAALLSCLPITAFALYEPPHSMTAMTFNIRYLNDNDPEPWSQRKFSVAKIIIDTQPDIVGTQEGVPEQLKDIDALIQSKGYHRFGEGRDGNNHGEACAIYWNTHQFQWLEGGTFWLSETPHVPSKTWGNATVRIATWVLLRHNHRNVLVLNTHFDHQSELARTKSAELISRKLSEMRSKAQEQIVMGDFNAPQGSAPWRILSAAYRDSWDEATEKGPENVSSSHMWKGLEFSDDATRIDWILLGGDLKAQECELITVQHKQGFWPSDHFPYMCRITNSAV